MGVNAKWSIAAFVWGFAEATLFFIVPDVLLTLAAIRLGWQQAVKLLFISLFGALLGGATMFVFAVFDLESARAAVDSVPLISTEMITKVEHDIQNSWLWQMMVGAMTGTPYKVYAISAPGAGIPLWGFILGSVLARTIRWVLVIGIAALIFAVLKRVGFTQIAVPAWTVLWISFYGFFSIVMSQ